MKGPKAIWDIFAVLLSLIFCYSYITYGVEYLALIPVIFLLLNKSGEFLIFRAVQPMLILPLVLLEGNLLFGIGVLVIGVLSSSAVSLLRNLGKERTGNFANINFIMISACFVADLFGGTALKAVEVIYIIGCVFAPIVSAKKNLKEIYLYK